MSVKKPSTTLHSQFWASFVDGFFLTFKIPYSLLTWPFFLYPTITFGEMPALLIGFSFVFSIFIIHLQLKTASFLLLTSSRLRLLLMEYRRYIYYFVVYYNVFLVIF